MNLNAEDLEVIRAVKYYPSISVLVSFEPAISAKTELQHRLKTAADTARRELQNAYQEAIWKPVYEKLEQAIAGLDYEAARRSVAIYVSPLLSKTFYFDLPIQEKIIIDESFEIRDLVYARQHVTKAVLLLLSAKHAKAFLIGNEHLLPLTLSHADNAAFYNDPPEAVSNFSDASGLKDIRTDKFLRGVDDSLTELLKTHNLPVLLMGAEHLLGSYGRITKNKTSIAHVIQGNYEDRSPAELLALLKPHISKLRADNNAEAVHLLGRARSAGRLEVGIKAAWAAASRKLVKTLVVEKDFMFPADRAASEAGIQAHVPRPHMPYYIKDAVDDIIEKVIESGGEVIFIEEMPEEYQHIALIRYY